MVIISRPNGINWQVVLAVGSVASLLGIALWIGQQSRQIDVNTNRLTKLEEYHDKGVNIDADLIARVGSIEQRLNRLESAHPDGGK